MTALVPAPSLEALIPLVIDALHAANSKKVYGASLRMFFDWYRATGAGAFNRQTVLAWKEYLFRDRGYSPQTVGLRLSAVRKLADEAQLNGYLDQGIALGILRVSSPPNHGRKIGRWLTQAEALSLLHTGSGPIAARDRVLLGLMLGCGLRCSEAVSITLRQIEQREGRWCIIDLPGKGGRVRTVPMPAWHVEDCKAWVKVSGITDDWLLRSFGKLGSDATALSRPLDLMAVSLIVHAHGKRIGVPELTPHDLRRTFARLARKGGAPIEQIQLTLGHASSRTTELYMNAELDLARPACDAVLSPPKPPAQTESPRT